MAHSSGELSSCRLGVSADWTGQQIEWTGGRTNLAGGDPQVSGSGCQAAVAEEQLNAPHICAGFKQMNRESVSERMRRNYLTNAGDLTGLLTSPPYRACADVFAGDVAWEEPVTGFVYPPPGAQDLQ
jgi:hypothetical protein